MRNYINFNPLPQQIGLCRGDQIPEDQMDGIRGIYGAQETWREEGIHKI
jgi:hypothetical protein